MFIYRFEQKKRKIIKKIELQYKNIKKNKKNQFAHENFHLYCTNQNYKLQYTLDIYIYMIYAYLDLIYSLGRRGNWLNLVSLGLILISTQRLDLILYLIWASIGFDSVLD
jgi:hypothetical protein